MLATGDEVLIAAGYDSSKGTVGHIYQYTGSSTDPIDLASTNYKTGPWTDLGAVKYASQPASGTTTNSQQLTQGDIVQVTQGHDPAKGTVNDLYAFKGTTGTTLDLASANFADGTMWTHLGVPKFDTTPVATKFATVSAGDEVLVAQGYDPSKGVVGHYYEYTGVQASLDLASTNYTTGPWLDLGGVKYLAQGVTPNRQLLTNGDIVQVSPGYDSTLGIAGDLYAYTGATGTTVDLATANYKDTTTWTDLGPAKASGTTTNSQQLNQGDLVQVSQGYDAAKGIAGDFYAYKGTSGTTLDLAGVDYTDTSVWTDLGVPKFASQGGGVASNSQIINHGDIVEVLQGYDSLKGKAGELYKYLGTSGGSANLAVANYNDTINWADIGSAVPSLDTALSDVTTKLQPITAGALVKVVEGHASGKGIIGDIYQYVGNSSLPIDLAGSDYTDQSQWKDMTAHLDTSSVGVKALDVSQVSAVAGAAAIAASFAGAAAVSVSVGISQADNSIDGEVAAYIKGMAALTTGGDNVNVSATDAAAIQALSAAAAISIAIGGAAGVSVAGGGADAENNIDVKDQRLYPGQHNRRPRQPGRRGRRSAPTTAR